MYASLLFSLFWFKRRRRCGKKGWGKGRVKMKPFVCNRRRRRTGGRWFDGGYKKKAEGALFLTPEEHNNDVIVRLLLPSLHFTTCMYARLFFVATCLLPPFQPRKSKKTTTNAAISSLFSKTAWESGVCLYAHAWNGCFGLTFSVPPLSPHRL